MFEAVGTFFATYPAFKLALLGAGTGLAAAARVDFDAFRKFQTFDEYARYNWSVAAHRWLQGAFYGALATTPFGSFFAS